MRPAGTRKYVQTFAADLIVGQMRGLARRAPAARRTRRTLATLSRCTFTARAVLRTDLPSHSSPVTRTTMSFGQDGGEAQRTRSPASQRSIACLLFYR